MKRIRGALARLVGQLLGGAGAWIAAVAAFAMRCGARVMIDSPDATWINDPDACFHMRRVFLLLARGDLPVRDYWSDHPQGVVPYVAPLLDWIVWGVCRLCGLGPGDEAAVDRVGAFVPAVLGACTVFPVYGIARRIWGPATATGAALVLALLPGHVLYTRYGMVDHHVLESLLLATLVWATMGEGKWRPAVLGALCLLGLALAWNGFALYVIAFAGVSAFAPWRTADPGFSRMPETAIRTLVVFLPLLAVCVVLPGHWFRAGEVRYDAPTTFHLALTGACALWCAVAVRLYRMPAIAGPPGYLPPGWLERWPWTRAGAVAGAGAAIAILALVIPGPMRDAFVAMFAFPSISVNRVNLEGRPVWQHTQWIFDHLSGLSFLLPLALFSLCSMAEEDGRDVERLWNVSGWALAFFLLTVAMTRFTYAYAPFLAVVIAGLGWATQRATMGFRPWLARGEVRAVVAAVIVAGCLLPGLDSLRLLAQGQYGDGPPRRMEAFRRLRDRAGDPGDWRRPDRSPAWGVLGPWGYGHAVKFWSRLPVVSDNMGVGFEKEFRFSLECDEEAAWRLLRELRVRWVIVQHDLNMVEEYAAAFGPPDRPTFAVKDKKGEWQVTDDYGRRVTIRLMWCDGSATWRDDGLSHFRLGPACPEAGKEGIGPYEFKCFEVVAGARLTGSAPPGTSVVARASCTAEDGRSFEYSRRVTSDGAGRFAVTVPYATTYTISAGDFAAQVEVPESAVQAGAEVRVP